MDIGQIARRFPLVARPRPTCPPLTERVDEVDELARSAEQDGKLNLAAVAQNKAALIASDCGMPDLARSLCWRHTEIYLRAQPLSAQEARYALEPVVNIARLLIRDGDGHGAYRLLAELTQAAKAGGEVHLDGRSIRLTDLMASPEDRRQLYRWLWTILLGDGTRALVTVGEWEQARNNARQHRGVGNRLLDGRQIETLARCLGGNPEDARAFLDASDPTEPWERSVAPCLAALCQHRAGGDVYTTTATMVEGYLDLDTAAELVVFRTRLGLSALDLAEPQPAHATAITGRLLWESVRCDNGYVAREVLAHPICRERMGPSEVEILRKAVRSAGLDRGDLPTSLERKLIQAVDRSVRTTEGTVRDRAENATEPLT